MAATVQEEVEQKLARMETICRSCRLELGQGVKHFDSSVYDELVDAFKEVRESVGELVLGE